MPTESVFPPPWRSVDLATNRQTIRGDGDEENDPHAGLSDFLDLRDDLLDPVIPFQWNQYLFSHDLPVDFTLFSSKRDYGSTVSLRI
jgi:hypothetical protein